MRPTMDHVKESLFNILGDTIIDQKVLSLFAGSGSLGLEALSRGASHVTFVDRQTISIQAIEKNLAMLGVEEEAFDVYQRDALSLIERFFRQKHFFDIIFLDPPYYQDFIKKTLLKLEAFDILTRFSYLVLEHAKDEPVEPGDFWTVLRTRKFGATHITILPKKRILKRS